MNKCITLIYVVQLDILTAIHKQIYNDRYTISIYVMQFGILTVFHGQFFLHLTIYCNLVFSKHFINKFITFCFEENNATEG